MPAAASLDEKASGMDIVVDDLSGRQIAEFLEEHVQEMRSITPLESKHALDLDELRVPEVAFWSVLDGDALVGCRAIKKLDAGHAELKSMRTSSARKRSGIASQLLEHVLTEAKRIRPRRTAPRWSRRRFLAQWGGVGMVPTRSSAPAPMTRFSRPSGGAWTG